jgi:uroporphyrinogen-III synthase
MKKIYLLSEQKYKDVENLEIFQIEYIKSDIDLTKYDALVFTSKNGVKAINSFNQEWKKIPSFAIAQKTANDIINLGGTVEFIGNSGHGNDFAYELIDVLKDKNKSKKVLYIKALKTVSNLPNILKENGIFLDELVAYKTSCKKSDTILEDNSIFIFSSPSSVECFFKQYSWKDSYKAVVIGKTTAEFLPSNIDYKISSKTSIEECIKLAKQLF